MLVCRLGFVLRVWFGDSYSLLFTDVVWFCVYCLGALGCCLLGCCELRCISDLCCLWLMLGSLSCSGVLWWFIVMCF